METINLREDKYFGKQYSYILDHIDWQSISEDKNLVTDKNKIDLVFYSLRDEFIGVEDYDSEIYALAAYLRKDPYFVWFPITVGGIAEVGKEWGYCRNEKEYNKFVRHFRYLLAGLLVRAKNKYYPENGAKGQRKLFWKYICSDRKYQSLGDIFYRTIKEDEKYILALGADKYEFNSLDEAKEYAQASFEKEIAEQNEQ